IDLRAIDRGLVDPVTFSVRPSMTLLSQDIMKEKLSNGEIPIEQLHGSVALEGDVYSQALKNDKSGYVCGLGIGPIPSLLWGCKSSLRNVCFDGFSYEVAHKLEQQINEFKELNKK
ncbi:hypothetical protein HAX54_021410, partial [Datura stramonium]|nr:hypothetical protein [Datura stramonium]